MLTEKVTFSLPCLKSLVNSDTSCVFCKTNYKRSLTLLPLHLHDLKQSVREILSSKVTTYDIELGGIILSHKNVKICSSVEMNDGGHFTLDYVADIYIFTPQIGSILSGRINKKGRDVLGCLVHSVFNVALPRPRYEEDCPKKWIGSKAFIGQTVTFSVVKLDFTGRLPYIRGQLMDFEDKGTTDDDGADSGMGYQESNEDDCSMLGVIDPQPSGENVPSVSSLKRKRDLNSSLSNSPKSKKRRFKGNSSDEGLSGEESLSVDPFTSGTSNSSINKDKANKNKSFLLKNFVETEFDDVSVKFKEEPIDETSCEVNTSSKSKKKKRDKASPSTSSLTDLEKLSSHLLTDALEKTKIKKENMTTDTEGDESTVGSLSGISKLKKKKLSKRAGTNVMENLSFSLLKEAMELNSLSEKITELTGNQLQNNTHNKLDELPDKKMKKKKKHSHDDEMEHHTKLKLNSVQQSVASEDIGNFLEGSEIVKQKDKSKKHKEDTVKKFVQSKLPGMPIKEEVEDVVDVKKKTKKKKHKEISDMIEISSSLLDQAIKEMSVKSKK